METTHDDILGAVTRLETQVTGVKRELDDIKREVEATKEMVEAWHAVKTGGKLITWLAKLAAAVIGLVVFVKAGAVAFVAWGSEP